MSIWLKRSVSLAGVVGVLACSALAASAVNHIIDATYLTESAAPARPGKAPAPTQESASDPRDRDRDAEGTVLAARNMFCSSCAPGDIPAGPSDAPAMDSGIPTSVLPLELLATNLAPSERFSFVTVRHAESGRQGSFFIGDALPLTGAIERIEGTSVVFHNPDTDRLERISLVNVAARHPPEPIRSREPKKQSMPGNPYSEHVIKLGDTSYEVERSMIDNLIQNPAQVGARVRPTTGPDGNVGMQVFGVRQSSPLAAIGVQNGDTIQAINGMTMTMDPDKLLEMYTKLSEASDIAVSVRTRTGEDRTLSYRIR